MSLPSYFVRHHLWTGVLLFLCGHATAPGASFVRDIAPIFAAKCVTCHNKDKMKGGYDLETFEALLRAGDSEEVPIVPGHPEQSRLLALLQSSDDDERMPQKAEALPPGQIALVREWIQAGARLEGGQSNVPLHTLIATTHPAPPTAYQRPVPVRALAFNHDGTELAVGGHHEVSFWDAGNGKLKRRMANFAQQVYSIAYSPNGRWLAVASGTPGKLGQVNLCESDMEPDSPAPLARAGRLLGTARDAMLVACFAPAGDRLVVGGADNTIRVYHVESGQQEWTIEQHADWVLGLSFNHDGSLVASGSRDKTARVFSVKTGELESTYVGHSDAVFAVAFAKDGKHVCSAGRDKSLHLWEAKEGKKAEEVKGFEREVLRLAMGSNNVFSCSADRQVREHSVAPKKLELVRTFKGHEDVVYALSLHETTGRLASGSFDGEVRIWDLASGQTVRSFIAAPGYRHGRHSQTKKVTPAN